MELKTHDYTKYADEYSKLGIEGTFFLAFRDIPNLLREYGKGNKALDYGCGNGRSTRFLKNQGFDTVGVDINIHMIEKARLMDDCGSYELINSGVLPYEDETFDIIFSSFVFIEISSLNEITRILIEMKRVLKRDGCIIFVTGPADGFKGNWISFSYDFPENNKTFRSGDIAKLQIKGTNVVLYDYYWTEQDYKQAIENSGLKLLELIKPMGRNDDPIEWRDEAKIPYIVIYVVNKY